MNFYKWLKLHEAVVKDPYEAMEVLGLKGLAGQVLDAETLKLAYRKMAAQYHPDVNPSEDATEKTVMINGAKEVLDKYVGRTLPNDRGTSTYNYSGYSSSPSSSYTRDRGNIYKENSYTESQIKEWADKLADLNYFQLVVKAFVQYMPAFSDFGEYSNSLGSQESTNKLTKGNKTVTADDLLAIIKRAMSHDGVNYPTDIVDMKINERWGEGWVTYRVNRGYRSICFKKIKEAKKKAPGVGMKREDVVNYLYEKGIRSLGNDLYGYFSHMDGRTVIGIMIRLQPKVLKVVRRYRHQEYGKSIIGEVNVVNGTFNYGDLTKEILDKIIAYVERKAAEKS